MGIKLIFGQVKQTNSLKDMSERERVRLFIEDILAPIISEKGIDESESKILNSAWFMYGMDVSYQKDEFKHLIDNALQARTDVACDKTLDEIRDAFRRICTMACDATYNEFETLIDWFNERAHRVGGSLFSCRETSRWAEEHFRSKIEAIRRGKNASVDDQHNLSDTNTTPKATADALQLSPSIGKTEGTAEVVTSANSSSKIENGGVGRKEKKDTNGACDEPPKETLIKCGESSSSNSVDKAPPATLKTDPSIDPPTIVNTEMPVDFWVRLDKHVDTLLRELPQHARRILDEFGPVERANEKMMFHDSRGDRLWKVFQVTSSEASKIGSFWIIGDIHGDLLALEAAFQYIEHRSSESRIVFLGDLFDRGRHSYPVVLRVLQLISLWPGRLCLLAGNHDVGMTVDTASHPYSFRSRINPSDFVESLNARRHEDKLLNEVGRTIASVAHSSPRAIFFEDGLFLAHGGIPQGDMWDNLKTIESLNAELCLTDFTFRRTKQSKRKAGVRRDSDYSDFGFQDFGKFCYAAEKALGFLPKRMVRGHDHVDANARYEVFEKLGWGNRVVTISNICYSQTGSDAENRRMLSLDYVRQPAIIKAEVGKNIEIHVLNIPPKLVNTYYPEIQEPPG